MLHSCASFRFFTVFMLLERERERERERETDRQRDRERERQTGGHGKTGSLLRPSSLPSM